MCGGATNYYILEFCISFLVGAVSVGRGRDWCRGDWLSQWVHRWMGLLGEGSASFDCDAIRTSRTYKLWNKATSPWHWALRVGNVQMIFVARKMNDIGDWGQQMIRFWQRRSFRYNVSGTNLHRCDLGGFDLQRNRPENSANTLSVGFLFKSSSLK